MNPEYLQLCELSEGVQPKPRQYQQIKVWSKDCTYDKTVKAMHEVDFLESAVIFLKLTYLTNNLK